MEEFTGNLERYRLVLARLEKLQTTIESLGSSKPRPGEGWLDNDEVSEILRVSRRQLQNYRDQGVLPFSQFGNKIYYRWIDVEAHFMKNYKKNS